VYNHLSLNASQIILDSLSIPTFLSLTEDPKVFGASTKLLHKISILPYLSELTPECDAIGACNTVYIKKTPAGTRKLCGANTDCYCVRDAFLHNVEVRDRFKGKPGMVIGAGGSCRGAIYVLVKWLGCSCVYLVNRSSKNAEGLIADCKKGRFTHSLLHIKTVVQAKNLKAPGAIVCCIPNKSLETEEEVEVRKVIKTFLQEEEKVVMLEMCYRPKPYTEIVGLAEMEGWQVILGTEAMIYQGLEQDCIWTGREMEEFPLEDVKATIAAALEERHRSL
jgi:quinate dehydrogenase